MNFTKVFLASVLISTTASAIDPVNRFYCTHPQAHLEIDMYATGHPMGGIGLYTGLMKLTFSGAGIKETVHFGASSSERPADAYKIVGQSQDINRHRYSLYFRELPDPAKEVLADLKIDDIGPFPGPKDEIRELRCKILSRQNGCGDSNLRSN